MNKVDGGTLSHKQITGIKLGLHEKSYLYKDQAHFLPVARNAHVQLQRTMFGTCHSQRKKGKFRPVGMISHEVMRAKSPLARYRLAI